MNSAIYVPWWVIYILEQNWDKKARCEYSCNELCATRRGTLKNGRKTLSSYLVSFMITSGHLLLLRLKSYQGILRI